MKRGLDDLDRRIIRLLGEDGRASVGTLASRLGVTAPTVRSRLHHLEQAGMLQVAGLIDPCHHQELITALIGLNVRSYGKLGEVVDKISQLDNVNWVAVVTGRYDLMVQVVVEGGVSDLYRLTSEVIPQVGVVDRSETFVVMAARNTWVRLPKGFEEWGGALAEGAPVAGGKAD